MRMHAAAAAVLLLLAASACHADSGRPQRPSRPSRPQRPLPPSRPQRPSRPPRTQFAPDGDNDVTSGEIIGADDAPPPAPMEMAVVPAVSVPPAATTGTPVSPPIETVVEPPPITPPPITPIASTSAEEGDLRLVARVDVNGYATGALQVFLDGAFGAVCVSDTFSPADADVACRQMGFIGGTSIPLALFESGPLLSDALLQEVIAPFVLENLGCAGTETRLLDCPGVMEERDYTIYIDTYVYEVARRARSHILHSHCEQATLLLPVA
eukprot:jgi/Ulvmu1/5818/UM025_0075.1